MVNNPKFIIFTGPMFGGKTTRLLSEVERYRYQKKSILAYKPNIDDRYDDQSIVTHNGFKLKAKKISNAREIYSDIKNWEMFKWHKEQPTIVVDEAFMIKESGLILPHLYRSGYTILTSTLQLSASCAPFEEVMQMLPWATKIEKCPAVCTICGRDAFYTYRKVDDLDEIAVGGSELYEPRCWDHHPNFSSIEIKI